jgi:hypothetical protein
MTWTEFLIHVLKAHAHTLHRLTAFFGEAEFLKILETAGESTEGHTSSFKIKNDWLPTTTGPEAPSHYLELEGAVQEMHLSSVLEFHIWTYPFYRIIIESSVDLKAKIPDHHGSRVLEILVQEAVMDARSWTRKLPILPELTLQTQNIAQVPWVRFRTTVLGKTGRRPMAALN